MKRWPLLLVGILFILLGFAKTAEQPVKATGDNIWGDDKKKLTFIEGNVRIVQGSTVITTDKAEVDLDKKIATFESGVKLTHPDVTIEADCLEYNFKKKNGTFYNDVSLNRAEVKDKEGKVTKDAFKLNTAELYFESDTKNFIAKSQNEVVHKDFTATADEIKYDDQKQELLFQGHAYLRRPNGEEIQGKQITINTQTNSFIVQDQVKLLNDDVTIAADSLEYDYKKKNGTFINKVILERAETKDKRGKVTKDKFKLITDKLYFESESKDFVTQNKGTVEHKDFKGSADRIEYNDQKQELTFKKNAQLKRPNSEEIKGDSITIFIKDKNFVVNNNVNINFKVDSEKK